MALGMALLHQELSAGFQQFNATSLECCMAFYCLLQTNISAELLSQRQSTLPYYLTVGMVRITKLSVAGEFMKHGLGQE